MHFSRFAQTIPGRTLGLAGRAPPPTPFAYRALAPTIPFRGLRRDPRRVGFSRGRRKRCWISSEAELWLHETVVEGFGQPPLRGFCRDGCLLVASRYQSVFLARGCSDRTAWSTRARGVSGARLRMARRPQGDPRWADVYRSGSCMVEVRYQHEVRQQSSVGVLRPCGCPFGCRVAPCPAGGMGDRLAVAGHCILFGSYQSSRSINQALRKASR